ncbi:MAG: alpha/beta fold hydrolase [Pseudomonadota bacterium]
MVTDNQKWFLTGEREERPKRLFCLPYAGGSAAAYARWRNTVDPRIDLVPVQLPGRGARIREKPIDRIDTLARQLADAMTSRLDRPFALFGHSMGSVLAFETARALRHAGAPMPSALFVSARRGPQTISNRPPLHSLPDTELVARLHALGGTPAAVLEDEEMLRLMLPVVRADLKAAETYEPSPEPPLGCPIHAFGGRQDQISEDALSAWSAVTTRGFALTMFDGGHFFLSEHSGAMLAIMADALIGASAASA